MLEYPRWKTILVLVVLLVGIVFALPNVFGEQDALQVERKDGQVMDAGEQRAVTDLLAARKIATDGSYVENGRMMVRFDARAEQLKARDAVNETLSDQHRSALTTASRAPRWLQAIGAKPMPLGLDLRGGLYLLYEVDLSETVNQLLASYEQAFRRALIDQKVAFGDTSILPGANGQTPNTVRIGVPAGGSAEAIRAALARANTDLAFTVNAGPDGGQVVDMVLTPTQISDRQAYAITQNRTTLENRINELGVSESVVQQQGKTRLNVQLPGKSNADEWVLYTAHWDHLGKGQPDADGDQTVDQAPAPWRRHCGGGGDDGRGRRLRGGGNVHGAGPARDMAAFCPDSPRKFHIYRFDLPKSARTRV